MADIFVFGRLAGERSAELALSKNKRGPSAALRKRIEALEKIIENTLCRGTKEPIRPAALRAEIEDIAFRYIGFGRDEAGLRSALDRLAQLRLDKLPRVRPSSRSRVFNYDLIEIFELKNLIDVALAVASAGLERTETRGCHNRLDYLDQDDQNWLNHVLVSLEDMKFKVDKSPVEMDKDGN
jgi:succinate dehydrogenase/fumarate reductase flavoprotein subunit